MTCLRERHDLMRRGPVTASAPAERFARATSAALWATSGRGSACCQFVSYIGASAGGWPDGNNARTSPERSGPIRTGSRSWIPATARLFSLAMARGGAARRLGPGPLGLRRRRAYVHLHFCPGAREDIVPMASPGPPDLSLQQRCDGGNPFFPVPGLWFRQRELVDLH